MIDKEISLHKKKRKNNCYRERKKLIKKNSEEYFERERERQELNERLENWYYGKY